MLRFHARTVSTVLLIPCPPSSVQRLARTMIIGCYIFHVPLAYYYLERSGVENQRWNLIVVQERWMDSIIGVSYQHTLIVVRQ